MNNQALFSLKDKSKNLCHLLHFLFGALSVKYDLSPSEIGGKNDNNCQKSQRSMTYGSLTLRACLMWTMQAK